MPDYFLLTKIKELSLRRNRAIYIFSLKKNFLRTLAFSFSESASHYLDHRHNRESNTFEARLIYGSFFGKRVNVKNIRPVSFYFLHVSYRNMYFSKNLFCKFLVIVFVFAKKYLK